MFGFFLKKSFFDGWDNLFGLVLVNLAFFFIFSLDAFLFVSIFQAHVDGSPLALLEWIILAIAVLPAFFYAGMAAYAVNEAADYGKIAFRSLGAGFKATWKASLFLAILTELGAWLILNALSFYSRFTGGSGILGPLAAGLLFWIGFFCLISLQYYFPIYIRLKGSPFKAVKKCFLIALDNPLFSIGLWFANLVALAISAMTGFILPGVAGILLGTCDAIKLRVYKYDWLETHPEANRRKIPWAELIEEDKDLVGERTLRGMIFPWKEDKN